MADIVLNVEVREQTGTGGARATRRSGMVPGVLYGGPQDPAVLYGPDDVVRAIGEGLTIDRADCVRRPVETGGVTVDAVDCLVRARRRPSP